MNTRHSGRRGVSVLIAVLVIVAGYASLSSVHIAVARPVETATGNAIADTSVAGFQFTTNAFENVPVNTTINVTFTNNDATGNQHTFTILNRSDYVIPGTPTNANNSLTALLSHYGALVWVNASQGQTVTQAFEAPAVGWYEFVCAVAGHFQQGMYGYIAFGEPLPTNLSFGGGPTGPGVAVFVIVGTIVALTVLALVLGFVVGRRHGAVHEMPPERLGYPEPIAGAPVPAEAPPNTGR